MADSIFIVMQEAVYRHAIIGVFDDRSLAIDSAKMAAHKEMDDHHDFRVYEMEKNKMNLHVRQWSGYNEDYENGETLVATVTRRDSEIEDVDLYKRREKFVVSVKIEPSPTRGV